jgi:hypothetical protein
MSTLTEIEAAADALSLEQKQELLLYLATRLRVERAAAPEPRSFPPERLAAWVAEDEQDMKAFREHEGRSSGK